MPPRFAPRYMSDLSLYRKYRPQTFSNLVGQDHVRVTLMNALQEHRTVHAYLFCGPRGTGKTSTARLFAKALNCINPKENYEPCDACDVCRDITDGRLIDLVEIDAASNRRIDEIRELRDKIHFAPTRAKNKIYIIDEVHMLTKEAFNALLKMLEEPPSQVYFILATTEAHKIPETIISRCQRFDFKRIDPKTIMTRLSYIAQLENIEVEDQALEAIARNCEGGLRDAIGLFDQLASSGKLEYKTVQAILGLVGHESIEKFLQLLQQQDIPGSISFLQELYREGQDFSQFTKELVDGLREKLLKSVSEKKAEDMGFYLQCIDIFQQAYQQLKNALIPQLPLEVAVIKLLQPQIIPFIPTTIPAIQEQKPTRLKAPALTPPLKKIPEEKSSPVEDGIAPHKLDEIESLWPRVTELLKTPSLKQAVKNIKKMTPEGHVLHLEFLSQFYLEKVMESSLRIELESSLEKVFGFGIKVIGALQKIQLEPKIAGDITDEAAEIFGGEVVEE